MFHLHLASGWAFLSLDMEISLFFDFIEKCYLCLCIWFFRFLLLHDFSLFLVFHISVLLSYVFLNLSLALTKWPSSSAASSHPDIRSSLWPIILMKLFTEDFIWFIKLFIVSISSVCSSIFLISLLNSIFILWFGFLTVFSYLCFLGAHPGDHSYPLCIPSCVYSRPFWNPWTYL